MPEPDPTTNSGNMVVKNTGRQTHRHRNKTAAMLHPITHFRVLDGFFGSSNGVELTAGSNLGAVGSAKDGT